MNTKWEFFPLSEKTITDLFTVEESGAKGFISRYANKFLVEAPKFYEQIENGVKGKDYAAVAIAVHKLNGLGSTFGALGLSEECITLEDCAKEEDLNDADQIVVKIKDELDLVLDAMVRLSKSRGG